MNHLKFTLTSEHQATIDKIISSTLPHNNIDQILARDVLQELFETVNDNEVYGLTYIFFKMYKNIQTIGLYRKGFDILISREIFVSSLQASVYDTVIRPEFNASLFFQEFSKEYDLTIEQQLNEAADFVYSLALEKYDELFSMAIPTAEAAGYISALKESMKKSISEQMTIIQGQILNKGYQVKDKVFRGVDDFYEFVGLAMAEIQTRFATLDAKANSRYKANTIHNSDEAKKFRDENQLDIRKLYYMGFEPYDNIFAIRTQDIITVIADEGVGKTRFISDQVYKAIMAGVNVLVICGETHKVKIMAMIEAIHIFMRWALSLSPSEMNDPSLIKDLDIDELDEITTQINEARTDLYDNPSYGKLTFEQSACYESFEDTVGAKVKNDNIQMIVVDHTAALDSDGSWTADGRLTGDQARVLFLYKCEDRMTKDYNLTFLNTAHTSNEATNALAAGKNVKTRSGGISAATTKYASLVFLLYIPKDIKGKDQIICDATKVRDHPKPAFPLVLLRSGNVNLHTFDPRLQNLVQGSGDNISIDGEDLIDDT